MIQLRTYHPDDWDAIAVIHDRARLDELRSSVSVDAFLSLAATFENEGLFEGEVWVACEGETVVGFIAFAEDEVTWLYVSPDHYRRGIGKKLLRQAIHRCGNIVTTSVLSGNEVALQLYLSEGFKIIETKTGQLNGNESFSATGHLLELDKRSLTP
jgi:ribosomal protein S18 acetylase RimI-like enzyme